MKTKPWILLFVMVFTHGFSQTKNKNLNAQLTAMKNVFLSEDFEKFTDYTHPDIIQTLGGKLNIIQTTKESIGKMKDNGFSFVGWSFKDPSPFFKKGNELQCSLTQVISMQTPKGLLESEYSLIAISIDEGKNWKFIDTSGRDKKAMLQFFPNLHKDIVVKQKQQKLIN